MENRNEYQVWPKLYDKSPYDGFFRQIWKNDVRGWGGESPVLREVIRQHRPRLVVEVGTWLGQSAITMATEMISLGLPGELVCVDTWLGSAEFWVDHKDPERYERLNLRHGYPQVYYQFLANVCHAKVDDVITPAPMTSSIAAQLFRRWNLRADVTYIDASHSYDDVWSDLRAWEPLTTKCLFGHDYNSWPDVKEAVDDFFRNHSHADGELTFRGDFWVFQIKQ